MPTTNGDGFLHAVRTREYRSGGSGEIELWRYAFSFAGNQPVEDLQVEFTAAEKVDGRRPPWTGVFECAKGRHVEVLPWLAANAVVVAAANAVYIVDPGIPEQFNGFVAPVEINGVIFDESQRHMFVADSLRIYAFSSERRFRWISEPLLGYGARFRGCEGRVLAVEVMQSEALPEAENEAQDEVPSIIRLRTDDGTILHSRFRLASRY